MLNSVLCVYNLVYFQDEYKRSLQIQPWLSACGLCAMLVPTLFFGLPLRDKTSRPTHSRNVCIYGERAPHRGARVDPEPEQRVQGQDLSLWSLAAQMLTSAASPALKVRGSSMPRFNPPSDAPLTSVISHLSLPAQALRILSQSTSTHDDWDYDTPSVPDWFKRLHIGCFTGSLLGGWAEADESR